MIEAAEREGKIGPNTQIVAPARSSKMNNRRRSATQKAKAAFKRLLGSIFSTHNRII
jgi:hypothetical protein